MIEQLFGSKTRVKLLKLFYENPNRSFYVREITRRIDEQINSVRRELSNLLSAGIITSENTNNKLYYEVNQKYEMYHALSEMFGDGKAKNPAKPSAGTDVLPDQKDVPEDIRVLGHVDLAIMTGQFTRDERSGVDFLIVGDINQNQLSKFIADLEKKEGREVKYASIDNKEFAYRRKINDRFLLKVLESKKQILFDRGLLDLNQSPVSGESEDTIEKNKKG